jgi:DNA-directed RNA polymerase III subunit RPC3
MSAKNQILNEREAHSVLSVILVRREKIGKKRKKGEDEYEYDLKPDVSLRINHDRYGILIRDELIVKAAEDRWNVGAGIVMRAVCSASLHEESSLLDARTSKDVLFNEVMARIPNSTFPILASKIVGATSKSTADIVRAYLAVLAGEDQMIANGAAFLSKTSSTNPAYKIELERICIKIREALLAELVRQRLGERAGRVLATVIRSKVASEQTVSPLLSHPGYR